MYFSQHHILLNRRWAVWLAAFIAVIGAMAPTVPHALAFRNSPAGFEICTSEGMRTVVPSSRSSSAESPAGQDTVLSLSHCPFCLLSAERAAPPPHILPYRVLVQCGQQNVTVWQAFFFVTRTTIAPPPRGPPASP
jgi:hypothetical protein